MKKQFDKIKEKAKLPQPPEPKFSRQFLWTIVVLMLLVAAYSTFFQLNKPVEDISLTQLATYVSKGEVKHIDVDKFDIQPPCGRDRRESS